MNELINVIGNLEKEESIGFMQFQIKFGENVCFHHFPTFALHYLTVLSQYANYNDEVLFKDSSNFHLS